MAKMSLIRQSRSLQLMNTTLMGKKIMMFATRFQFATKIINFIWLVDGQAARSSTRWPAVEIFVGPHFPG